LELIIPKKIIHEKFTNPGEFFASGKTGVAFQA